MKGVGGELAPGPRPPLARMLLGKGKAQEQLGFLLSAAREYGPVVGFRYLNRRSLLLDGSEPIEQVLRTNNRNYLKSRNYEPVKLVVGEGLIVSEGEHWRRQRRLAQPALHRKKIADLGARMVYETEGMLQRWVASGYVRGEPFDVFSEMSRLTLRIVAASLFGSDLERHLHTITRAQDFLGPYVDSRMGAIPKLPHRAPTPRNLRYRRALADLNGVVYTLIESRRRNGEDGEDLLGMLLASRDEESGEAMSEKQIRDEVMTLLIAGNETTAVALSWTWWLLGQNPEAESKLREELERVLGGRSPTFEDLASLPYTKMVFQEAMRLYPPAWIISRRPIEDDEIAGFRVPKDTTVLISPYVTHRNPRYWEEPEVFEPERFSPERSVERPEFAYLPFGGGPRKCIGDRFAMTEGPLILATVASRYRLRLADDVPVRPHPRVTLRPERGVPVLLEECPRR